MLIFLSSYQEEILFGISFFWSQKKEELNYIYFLLHMAQPEICRVPKFLELEFREEQKLNKMITIENLIDKVVTYKVLHFGYLDKVQSSWTIPSQAYGGLNL